ncbi:conserved hypothetical protein [Leptospira interrogans serovar Manilae]|uniref:Uncharacterized protein n=1 Tax=Leptospira interrogans serovar Manilae TaxID=214675 RepID=A0AAQ1NX60_LEPIR|nr:hypothetical protein LEP1GSC013_0308 [Leptospira interrogans serovar Valbuzzi str. Duyster]SOR60192.1 conserved hypothetical protein [Leptospira interrogans serovar Manilae]
MSKNFLKARVSTILQTNLGFVVVPTLKSIYKVQIPTFFRIVDSLDRTHVLSL